MEGWWRTVDGRGLHQRHLPWDENLCGVTTASGFMACNNCQSLILNEHGCGPMNDWEGRTCLAWPHEPWQFELHVCHPAPIVATKDSRPVTESETPLDNLEHSNPIGQSADARMGLEGVGRLVHSLGFWGTVGVEDEPALRQHKDPQLGRRFPTRPHPYPSDSEQLPCHCCVEPPFFDHGLNCKHF